MERTKHNKMQSNIQVEQIDYFEIVGKYTSLMEELKRVKHRRDWINNMRTILTRFSSFVAQEYRDHVQFKEDFPDLAKSVDEKQFNEEHTLLVSVRDIFSTLYYDRSSELHNMRDRVKELTDEIQSIRDLAKRNSDIKIILMQCDAAIYIENHGANQT